MKKIIEDKRILTFYIIVIFGLVTGFSYALENASLAFNLTTGLIAVDDTAYGDTEFNFKDIDFKPILDSEVETNIDNVIKIDFTVGGANTNTASNIIYDIALADLKLDCNLISPYIKWKLVKDGAEISNGSLDYKFDTIDDGRLVLTDIQQDLPSYNASGTDYHNYTFYMWFSDSCQESDIASCIGKVEQSNLLNKYLSGKVEVELYTESKKALVRNPSTTLDSSICINYNPLAIANAPNLDNGNLIPVYYDDTEGVEVWKKADSTNLNNSWYDYNEKKWANAVIVDSTKKSTYQDADVNTTIADADIIAFYVWIPRYKYRVWNITRQGGTEDTYAYPAYSKGIEIEFESGTASTGNVKCTYDVTTAESATNLSDKCIYYGNTSIAITTTSGNSNFKDAWYTHPAFTFGDGTDKERTGFWIGKFETSGDEITPTVIPDVSALISQSVSMQFSVSKKFQNYLSSNLDAHMLTNIEWGAVTYLTHSIYGLCDGVNCQGVYINNSGGMYTGRSGGAIAGSDDLTLDNVYGSGGTAKYNTDGYYNYKGYKLDSSGSITSTKDISKVGSTTGNITGVYDMSGGTYEYVMGNMVNSSHEFYPSYSGNSWNGDSVLDSKYYNSYSYGTNYNEAIAFNRARLGDATSEVLGGTSSSGSWKVGSGLTGSRSNFVNSSNSWFFRGGSFSSSTSELSYFTRSDGGNSDYSFRSSIS